MPGPRSPFTESNIIRDRLDRAYRRWLDGADRSAKPVAIAPAAA